MSNAPSRTRRRSARTSLLGNNTFLFMHKTDEPVFTWIPDELVNRLKNTPLHRGKYNFMGPVTKRNETAADSAAT